MISASELQRRERIGAVTLSVVDGRKAPSVERLRLFAPEMHTMLRAVLNVIHARKMRDNEALVAAILEEVLNAIEGNSAQNAEATAPQPPTAA